MKRIPARLWDFPSALLLVLAQMVVSQRLFVTSWTRGLELAVFLTLIGVILGLVFGLSRFRAGTVALLAAAYSLCLLPLLTGRLFDDGTAWPERLLDLAGRLSASFHLFVIRRPVPDTILFVAFMAICFWIISLTAGYALTRAGNFLGAALPAGVTLFIIQMYDNASPDRAAFLAIYIFLCLLLLGRLSYVRKKFFWKEHKVWYSSEAAADLNLSILAISVVLVFVTWLAPASDQPLVSARKVWDRLTQPFHQTRQDLGNAIAGLQGDKSQQPINFYGSDLTLGQQASGGTDLLFKVRIPSVQTVARYYWRVRTYDEYLNGGWHTTGTSGVGFSPNHPLDAADTQGLPTGEFTFVFPDQSVASLITPLRPVWVSHPSILTYVPALNKQVEPVLFEADPAVKAGQKYTVHAVVIDPSILALKNAGTAYPGWVRNIYLQLPADLPPSVRGLAQEVAGDAATPYDAAQAITEYLRQSITYQKSIPPPPAGQDTLAWFLFDYKAGYCNYFATAEVVLLRTLGIPARMAVGYAAGEFQGPDQYVVREADAHAWPEVYFPGIGWIEFEPTVSQAPLERPSGIVPFGVGPIESTPVGGPANPPSVPGGETGGEGGATSGSGAGINSAVTLYILAGLAIAIVVSAWVGVMFGLGNWITRGFQRVFHEPFPVLVVNGMHRASLVPPRWLDRWAMRASLAPMERAFGVIYRSLQRLGLPATPARTPREAALALGQRLPAAAGEIQVLLEQMQANLYSEKPGDLVQARQAAESIRRQSLRAALQGRLAAAKRFLRMTR